MVSMPADWPRRVCAGLIDIIATIVFAKVGTFITFGVYSSITGSGFGPPPGDAADWFEFASLAFYASVYGFIEGVLVTSLGKMIVGLRIESRDGDPLRWRACLRALVKWAPVIGAFLLALVGYLALRYGNIFREDNFQYSLFAIIIFLIAIAFVLHLMSLVRTGGQMMHDHVARTVLRYQRALR